MGKWRFNLNGNDLQESPFRSLRNVNEDLPESLNLRKNPGLSLTPSSSPRRAWGPHTRPPLLGDFSCLGGGNIEKRIKRARADKGPDCLFSCEPS